KLNAKIKYIEIETFKHVGTASMATFSVEGSTVHHKQLIEAPEQYSPDVRNYLKFGEAVTGIQYLQGQQLRRIIIEELKRIYTKTDAILFPTIPISAPEIGKQVVQINDDKLDIVDALEYFNALANVSGFPSLSLPIGMDKMGLPLGIQFMGDAY